MPFKKSNNKKTSLFTCIASGSISQSSEIFTEVNRNKQCMGIATTAIVYTTVFGRNFLNTSQIDDIVKNGDIYYSVCRLDARDDFLCAEELNSNLRLLSGEHFSLEKIFPTFNDGMGTICEKHGNIDMAVNNVEKRLREIFLTNVPNDGYLFTSHNLTVAFWVENDIYYVFDSHSVAKDKTMDVENGLARFFSCTSLKALAILLLTGHSRDNSFFEIVQIRPRIIDTSIEYNEPNTMLDIVCPVPQKKLLLDDQTTSISRPSFKKPSGRPRKRVRSKQQDSIPQPSVNSTIVEVTQPDEEVQPILPIVAEPRFTCLGDRSGIHLNSITPFILKAPASLNSPATYRCRYCSAPFFEEEKTRKVACCGRDGANFVQKLPIVDAEFYSRNYFLKNARQYNNLFAFSALGTSGHLPQIQGGVSFVKVLGRVYHRVFDLSYRGSTNNGMLYIEDNLERERLAQNRHLNIEILQQIDRYLHSVNPLISAFRRLHSHTDESAHLVFERTSRTTHGPILGDMPVCNEIAAIVKTGLDYEPRKVIVWKIGNARPHNVDYFDASYECLQYPLLFPHATAGWHKELKNKNNKKITQVKYYRMLLLSEPRFTQLWRLGQEYFVDMWNRVEEERLMFIRFNQESVLRVATRQEIDETIAGEGGRVAGKIYLPSSFTHGPRYMQKNYHDGMALVGRLGKPTYFLTITCNPRWPEIQNSLRRGETASDRPDLCNRVFYQKLRYLLHLIYSGKLLGELSFLVHVIEFQKRGLPHAHLAIRIEGGGPIYGDQVDRFVRATIPSEDDAGGRLRKAVLHHMLHGPCGAANPRSPCMDSDTGKCRKFFPKTATDVTYIDDRGYVIYKRPCLDSVNIPIRGSNDFRQVDDSWVVPYNPAILLIMDCHVNLEISTSTKTLKYMMKYIYKGPDSARIAVIQNPPPSINNNNNNNSSTTNPPPRALNDEIEAYVSARYISSSEAIWRLLEYDLCSRRPTVLPLPVHLPNREFVVFRPGQEAAAAERNSSSKLLLYFERPQVEELAHLTYLDFYERYIIVNSPPRNSNVRVYSYTNRDNRFIVPRQKGRCVTRLYWLSPSLGEIFFLRMLLAIYPASSYEDLRTVEGQVLGTFQEAAKQRGLLDTEDEYFIAMREAVIFSTGSGLRQLFLSIIIFGGPAGLLWDEFKDNLSEDFLRLRPGPNPDNLKWAYTKSLILIERMLRRHGRDLRDMGLPEVEEEFYSTEAARERIQWDREICKTFSDRWMPLLNPGQLSFVQMVTHPILEPEAISSTNQNSTIYYLDGPAGTGKTLVLNVVTNLLRSNGHIVLCTASTGLAALNYQGGTTAHSMFRLPIDSTILGGGNISWNSQRAQLLREASCIIWDECTMINRGTISILNNSLKDLCQCQKPFGGKVIIFAGDFRQIAPILEYAGPNDIIRASIKFSPLWQGIRIFKLTEPQRTRDREFSQFLLAIGEGRVPEVVINESRLVHVSGINNVTSIDQLINFVFPDEIILRPEDCVSRAILSPTNAAINVINNIILNRLPGDIKHLLSADSFVSMAGVTDNPGIGTEVLNRISAKGVPDHKLCLKVGSVCILIRNLSFEHRLVNGTKLIIKSISKYHLEASVPGSTEIVTIPRICFKFSAGRSGIEMIRRQFPIKLAYALTINKSQGQTLDRVGVDLRSNVFAHGQLYVALGRVRSSQDIRILVSESNVNNLGQVFTRNVVYRDLLT